MINIKEIIKYTRDLNVLIVEDHNELRSSLSEALGSIFKSVSTAENGVVGLRLYKENYSDISSRFDIVLSDIKMPLLDGVELTKKIYDIDPKQIVIIISAHDESEYLLPLVNIGIEYFVKKPINYDDFFSVLLTTSKKLSPLTKSTQKSDVVKIIMSDSVIYDREVSSLLENGKNIYLTKFEIVFLNLLSKELDKIYPNETIVEEFDRVNEKIDMQNIRKLVSKLRKKLPQNSIESVYGIGYKLVSYNKA
jgi:DNA-binding response OmpR family regulator